MANTKTMADLIREESKRFDHFCYIDKPYPCGLEEGISYFKDYAYPAGRLDITRDEKQTIISIKPLKGSHKRKPYTITLWICW